MHAQVPQAVAVARIGPNAIVQARAAIRAFGGEPLSDAIFERASLAHYNHAPPTDMVPQTEVAALFEALNASCSPNEAGQLMREAGLRTGDYILAHRIPLMAQHLLKRMPRVLGARLLLSAIRRHAWTFAGDGAVHCTYGRSLGLSIAHNPIAMPGCPWHVAVFECLFGKLVDPDVRIVHTRCCATGAAECHFEIVRR